MIIGFGDIAQMGYLDRLYVHEDYQRQGVASVLCGQLEQAFAEIIYYSRIIKIAVAKKPLENHTKFSSGFSMRLVADNRFDFIRF